MSDQTGDIKAAAGSATLSELYRRHAGWLVRRLRARWGAEADDIVQDSFVRLSRYDDSTSIGSPRALLIRIASNLAADRARRASHRASPSLGTEGLKPEGISGGQYESTLLREVVADMPEHLRDVFLLSRIAGFRHREIAQRLGISEKTVEWRLARALTWCVERMRGGDD
ncbi:RNA polymerase sigma factor [Brevundimonas lutea]|uniref:RNA polymerase sigma factor n=1 Tax=Brevundimonas lutea TaxID=2293980 RepID=UPI0013CE3FF3|nr:RNA polymerase sigma factor [Brevundimonas lutea]